MSATNVPNQRGLNLQPLRIPAGWAVLWNTLYASSCVSNGDFGGSSVFTASNDSRRFRIDVAFSPEFDRTGQFELVVEYQPWPRTKRGKRGTNVPLEFDGDATEVHRVATHSYSELVEELDAVLARCSTWLIEGS